MSFSKGNNTESTGSNTVSVIVDFISENYTRSITLTDLAARLNYDYHYVSRLFRSLFHIPFIQFLNIFRLERAAELLLNDEKRIVDVALESGFQSTRTFNERFKAHYGVTPSEYRRAK